MSAEEHPALEPLFVGREDMSRFEEEICRRGAELTEGEENGRAGFFVTFAT